MRFLALVSALATLAVAATVFVKQIHDRPTVLAPRRS